MLQLCCNIAACRAGTTCTSEDAERLSTGYDSETSWWRTSYVHGAPLLSPCLWFSQEFCPRTRVVECTVQVTVCRRSLAKPTQVSQPGVHSALGVSSKSCHTLAPDVYNFAWSVKRSINRDRHCSLRNTVDLSRDFYLTPLTMRARAWSIWEVAVVVFCIQVPNPDWSRDVQCAEANCSRVECVIFWFWNVECVNCL